MSSRMLLLLLSCVALHAGALDQYRGAWLLKTTGNSPSLRAELPDSLYHKLHPDAAQINGLELADVAVFNTRGEPLPWRILPEPAARVDTSTQSLAFFPLEGSAVASGTSGRVEIDDILGRVSVQWNQAVRREPVTTWIIDARKVMAMGGKGAFALELAIVDTFFMATATVEGSDDLRSWRSLSGAQSLARIKSDGMLVERTRLEINDTASFLRLQVRAESMGNSAERGSTFWIGSMQARFATQNSGGQRWKGVALQAASEDSTGWIYEAKGTYPVTAVWLEPPNAQAWGKTTLQTRSGINETWVAMAEVQIGERDLVPIAKQRKLYWRVQAIGPKAAFGEQAPRLHLLWKPEIIEAVRGGQQDLWIAAGMHPKRLPDYATLASFRMRDTIPGTTDYTLPGDLAQWEPWVEKAGNAAIEAPAEGWQKLAMWVGLGLALIVVALMARKIWKEG